LRERLTTPETVPAMAHLNNMGRDEMNLAEFPLATLADRAPRGCKTLVFADRIWDRGQAQHRVRRLTISASDKYGLPTAIDDEVILGLVQVSKAADFADRRVRFTRYQLLRILGWRDEGRSYRRVEQSLKRWLGVTLYYENAWWDKTQKRWVDAHFHLLDDVVIYQRPARQGSVSVNICDRALSSFTWNEMVFRSFQAGFLRQIDLDFYRTLKLATTKRMYRFLDKHFYFSNRQRHKLVTFAREHIGVSRNYDVAQLKRRLTPAIKELEGGGYLKPMSAEERFIRISQGEWDIVFVQAAKVSRKAESREPMGLEAQLVQRGVTASMATQLVGGYSVDRIRAKLQVFDQLVARRDARISKNPAGYLVESIRKDYLLPVGLPKTPPVPVVKGTLPLKAKNSRRHCLPENKALYEEQQKIEKHLAKLSPEGIAELEDAALKSSPSFLAKSFQRAVATGSEMIVRQYRRCLLERHLRTVFRSREESTAGR